MKFGSVCSGIEAASVAWQPLGWKAQWLAEIEPFPCALLAHHYPDTPNLGDMTKYMEWPTDDKHAIDLLCGGTPCQSFSVAGLRKGLDDPRGNLMLTFGAIAAKYRPEWLVWENVPGVLSSNGGRDFGSFLGMLGQLGYGFAYRVLDAQYFGVAQRRRRVFVVGCLGDWRSAAAVLFERHSLQGHPAPIRQAGQGTAHGLAPSLTASGRGVERAGETRGQDPVVAVPHVAPTLTSGPSSPASHGKKSGTDREVFIPVPHAQISPALKARDGKGPSSDGDGDGDGAILVPMLAHSLRGEGFDASEDGTGRGTPLVPVCFDTTQITSAANYSNPKAGDPCHPLAAQAHVPCIAFPERMSGTQCASTADLAPSMGALNPTAIAFQERGRADGPNLEIGGDLAFALTAPNGGGRAQERNVLAPAYTTKLHNTTNNQAGKVYQEYTTALDRSSPPPALLTAMQVRRLTPMECERLMGFPDGYTNVPHRGKLAADGNRYKALGNSWAVPNVRWIGKRIDQVASLLAEKQREAA